MSAQHPASTEVAIDEPVTVATVPPGWGTNAFTPPAAISGFIRPSLVYPFPDCETVETKFWL